MWYSLKKSALMGKFEAMVQYLFNLIFDMNIVFIQLA